MSHSSLRASSVQLRDCRHSLTPSRVRKEISAARLDKQWRELRCHATIEKDPEKMLKLSNELEQRKRRELSISRIKT
jgi:hypothetical protein